MLRRLARKVLGIELSCELEWRLCIQQDNVRLPFSCADTLQVFQVVIPTSQVRPKSTSTKVTQLEDLGLFVVAKHGLAVLAPHHDSSHH